MPSEPQSLGLVRRIVRFVLCAASGEWLLDRWCNGGEVILIRSLMVALWIVVGAELIISAAHPDAVWFTFNWREARLAVVHAVPWFGGCVAGVYVALYTRFSSQWNYLASLHNQIMASAMQMNPDSRYAREVLAKWQAGFVEDADELHLAKKPMFAGMVETLLGRAEVRYWFVQSTSGGEKRCLQLVDQLGRLRK